MTLDMLIILLGKIKLRHKDKQINVEIRDDNGVFTTDMAVKSQIQCANGIVSVRIDAKEASK